MCFLKVLDGMIRPALDEYSNKERGHLYKGMIRCGSDKKKKQYVKDKRTLFGRGSGDGEADIAGES